MERNSKTATVGDIQQEVGRRWLYSHQVVEDWQLHTCISYWNENFIRNEIALGTGGPKSQ